ncbi:MAG: hypothetical protein A3B25_00125 [Candidatus Ryanbacteria bacterium RIFCSPLOWO2_01_FULL_48_26]|uniref:Uncharacterized protein n=2 Tax=Parcubacteria group TaxID=1794811 RepID=A0A1G2DBZ5_9BACT|nr:MAG: hypothetical protein A3D67_02310 [Candidatus Lloydbacteria bacterium RIFCSPHIGHO2_02_FULL_51_22]OGZ53266.1 MAG: hypothetical protein A3B25_00125 [Candidatus Ryanbacteria bacterium RIFCSPLOWO2_01_FULL_48_26]
MSIFARRKVKIGASVAGGLILVFLLLLYYQGQGFIKIFSTAEERAMKKILTIDRSKFRPAEGLDPQVFEEEIKKLEEEKAKVLSDPGNAQLWFDFGYTKEFLNDHQGAILAWEKSFALQPLNFVTAQNLGNTYQYFIKDWEKAEFYYGKVLELRPDHPQAYQGLIDLYRYNWPGRKSQVEPLLLAAIKNDPENKLPYNISLVEFFADENDAAKAKIYLENVRELDESQVPELVETYPILK